MKTQLLFMASMLIGLTSATARTAGHAVSNGEDFKTARYRFAEPIMFIERGVEFLIFPDGSFDFNTEIKNNTSNVYYRINTKRNSVNRTYGAPGTVNRAHYTYSGSRGVMVSHDTNGQVRRIGNVFINYDREGRIKRAGSVYMSYQRGNGLLRQVGGLNVTYNRRGEIVHMSGIVNPFNTNFNYGVAFGHVGNSFIYLNDIDHYDDDYYYYRKNGTVKKTRKHIKFKQS
ncbi:hypothetical protein [Psychroserpens mesophilus]|uniref:hypothetical protein n=1 Tax=Psychroserpens mesophilus TaxID=325473 RepID=UPI003D659F08